MVVNHSFCFIDDDDDRKAAISVRTPIIIGGEKEVPLGTFYIAEEEEDINSSARRQNIYTFLSFFIFCVCDDESRPLK